MWLWESIHVLAPLSPYFYEIQKGQTIFSGSSAHECVKVHWRTATKEGNRGSCAQVRGRLLKQMMEAKVMPQTWVGVTVGQTPEDPSLKSLI